MIATTKTLNIVTAAIIIIGGLNWGLVGIFGINLIGSLFGEYSALSRIIYIAVGLSALYQVVMFRAVSTCWVEARPSHVVAR